MHTTKRAYGTYIFGLILFGSNGVVASFITLSSYEIVLLRSVLGAALLVCLFAVYQKRFAGGHLLALFRYKTDLCFIVLSGVAMAADWLFLFEAYAQIGVSLGMLINYTGPVIVMAAAVVLFNEALCVRKVIALLLACAGACCIGGTALFGQVNVWGLLCAVASAFAYAAMVLCNKKAVHITGLENSVVQLCATCLVVVVFVACKQGLSLTIEAASWPAILWLGLINTGVGCYLYFSSIGRLPAQTVAICGYIEPLVAVVLAAVVLGEVMQPVQWAGAVCIIVGALLGEGVLRCSK